MVQNLKILTLLVLAGFLTESTKFEYDSNK